MVLIADVVSNYKRRKIDATAAVEDIKWFLEIEDPTEDENDLEERHRNLQELLQMHSSYPFRGHQSPPLRSPQPASTISPEATVGEAVAHASGSLCNMKAVGTVWFPATKTSIITNIKLPRMLPVTNCAP